ncbi:MAG TPA: phosphohistidine phosphatase SixA [Candidatus Binatia bacterium]|jgi:phosphohistidine phosphatase
MNLYLLRHGIAVPKGEHGSAPGDDRPLTAKGIRRMRKAAKGLRRLGIPFDGILSSPLIRASQTADILAEVLGLQTELQQISGLAPESSVENLLFGLSRFENHEHLVLVGHEPLLSETAAFLMSGKDKSTPNIALKKGGICKIEIDALPPHESGILHWLLAPKQLRLLGA